MHNERLAIEQHKFISAGGTVIHDYDPILDVTYTIETGIGKVVFGMFLGPISKKTLRYFVHPLIGIYPKDNNYSFEKKSVIDQKRKNRALEAVNAVYPEINILFEATRNYLNQHAQI